MFAYYYFHHRRRHRRRHTQPSTMPVRHSVLVEQPDIEESMALFASFIYSRKYIISKDALQAKNEGRTL
jgi:hypothetical protein